MKEDRNINVEPCPFCGGKVTILSVYMGILFFDCADCGALVSFKADNPIALFNRRYARRKRGGGASC